MILQVSPESSWVVRGAAASILYLHIGGATAALLSGPAALAVRKGERLHRLAGNVFFVSMLFMSGIGAAVSPLLPTQRTSTLAGALAFYLVATAWATVRRPEGRVGRFETGAALLALGVAVAGAAIGWMGVHSPGGEVDGLPYQPFVVFGAVAALAAASDLSMIRRGGISGAPRIARHLWRMCAALIIAAASFAGQPKAVPEALRGSPILFLPALATLGLMIFWLVRVRSTGAAKPAAATP